MSVTATNDSALHVGTDQREANELHRLRFVHFANWWQFPSRVWQAVYYVLMGLSFT
jgi:hypothetical protein